MKHISKTKSVAEKLKVLKVAQKRGWYVCLQYSYRGWMMGRVLGVCEEYRNSSVRIMRDGGRGPIMRDGTKYWDWRVHQGIDIWLCESKDELRKFRLAEAL